ncbi:hypothetical protein niasHT_039402 [Heterodera trifolii]|uniref:Uncharacterized protein n=1 Tax=Heterodera trifolii TaxID=157864 RepID=A0ABD2J806_9BILA
MTNIGEHLSYAGASFNHVTNCNITLANNRDFHIVDETFKSYFSPDACPACHFFFHKDKLPKNALVMIDAEAVLSGQ